ncbi:hypothetical protein Taro_013573 [Colocasia esculenta]|uniref:Uncharacterized protein n=1 Tax=Colocasia esculenta TaxID=4460 RepID=A0A843UGC6_COLES|nr:hypothetical protein [Colocasia esculenta]
MYWSPASPVFPVPHFRELRPESLKLDLSSFTARLRGFTVRMSFGGGTVVVVVPWWYLMVVGCVSAVATRVPVVFSAVRENDDWTFFLSSGQPEDKSSSSTDAYVPSKTKKTRQQTLLDHI